MNRNRWTWCSATAPGPRRRLRTDLLYPATGAGVAFVRLEAHPDPVRVRAGWVSEIDIADLAAACYPDPVPLELEGVPA